MWIGERSQVRVRDLLLFLVVMWKWPGVGERWGEVAGRGWDGGLGLGRSVRVGECAPAMVKADNTTREHKNQGLLVYCAWLVASGKFVSCSDDFFEVGHTHNGVDQRFSTICKLLSRMATIETPSAFMDAVRSRLPPQGGREVHVEILAGTHDWGAFFSVLGVKVSGLTSTHLQRSSNHSWRICRRQDLPMFNKLRPSDWELEVPKVLQCNAPLPAHVASSSSSSVSSSLSPSSSSSSSASSPPYVSQRLAYFVGQLCGDVERVDR